MNDNRNADISALMDGELGSESRARVLARVSGDPEHQAVWQRFHLIGDALRGGAVLCGDRSIAAGVMAALEHEPAILAPRRRGNLQRRVVTGAIAASVAALAVFGLQGRVEEAKLGGVPSIAALRVAPPLAPAPGEPSPTVVAARPVDTEVLQRYFMSHSELRATQAVRPLPPQASLVGFSPDPVQDEEPPAAEGPEADGTLPAR